MNTFFFDSAVFGNQTVNYSLVSGAPDAERWEYGVLVESDGEQALIPAVSVSRRNVQELLGKMCRGIVTPVTARDVIEDWLAV